MKTAKWSVGRVREYGTADERADVCDEQGQTVFDVRGLGTARTIVAALNSHADLLAACEAKLAAFDGDVYDPDAFTAAAALCREAIAKAKGETP